MFSWLVFSPLHQEIAVVSANRVFVVDRQIPKLDYYVALSCRHFTNRNRTNIDQSGWGCQRSQFQQDENKLKLGNRAVIIDGEKLFSMFKI